MQQFDMHPFTKRGILQNYRNFPRFASTLSIGANQLAYVIYTSGTTGKPKGVMVEHRGLANLKTVWNDSLQMNEQDRVVQFASLSFDASIWEILNALFCGASLYLPSKSVILDFQLFTRFMNDNKITTATLPPSYATYLEPKQMPFMKRLITAGSSSTIPLVEKWIDHVIYVNAYGPTEDSVCSTLWINRGESIDTNFVSIGRPIHNHHVYITDKAGQLLPIGVPGELCLAGVGLARGYLNRPDLTTEKFVDNPFVPGAKMYRTGDLARWSPDGNIEYLGRIDHQVKIRGYRIELGEVESALMKVEPVLEATVIAHEGEDGFSQLCAYVVGNDSLTVEQIRYALLQELPSYMIPTHFIKLEQMPLTPNGKINRKALPAPEKSMQTGTDYVTPRTIVEIELAAIWEEILGLENVGVTNNFFDLGGHSLKVLQLIREISKRMGMNLPYRVVFDAPTIETMAQQIVRYQLEVKSESHFLKLNEKGQVNVFCFPSTISGLGMEYYEMAKRLENECVLYAYDFIDHHSNYTEMINEYVDSILRVQAQGPYIFLGYSAGGNLAFEITKVMEQKGYEISDIIMLDSSFLNSELQKRREELLQQAFDCNENISEWFEQVQDIPSVKNKSLRYESYMKQLTTSGVVHANIHNLVVKGLDKANWSYATRNRYKEYQGFGKHNELLNRQFIDQNAELIKRVLTQIRGHHVERELEYSSATNKKGG
ncbi:amino acid adenylation domain-containing protein [Paenibacillus thiaminolyticus]|uniref:amino acid adenylation domain-containing protein n=1 Tax=Paenibacillus thiaminolyticus TaxID=49283 RepID=UPI0035A6A0F5